VCARSREDRLTLVGVKLEPRIGVTPGERRQPQSCEADISLWGDFEAAATTDSLSNAIDYSKVVATVLKIAHSEEFNLLETLADRLAKTMLTVYPASRVKVRVRKRPASLTSKLDYVEVEMEES
jgi:dihydroneopterin aldolase